MNETGQPKLAANTLEAAVDDIDAVAQAVHDLVGELASRVHAVVGQSLDSVDRAEDAPPSPVFRERLNTAARYMQQSVSDARELLNYLK